MPHWILFLPCLLLRFSTIVFLNLVHLTERFSGLTGKGLFCIGRRYHAPCHGLGWEWDRNAAKRDAPEPLTERWDCLCAHGLCLFSRFGCQWPSAQHDRNGVCAGFAVELVGLGRSGLL